METLIFESTKSTPYINFDPTTHQLEIKGESYPENTAEYYQPVLQWLKDYTMVVKAQQIVVNIELIYFNSSTSKVLMDIFDLLDLAAANNTVEINWIYDLEDEDNLEYGEEFQEDLKRLKFNFIGKSEASSEF